MKINHQEIQKHSEHKKSSTSELIKFTAGAALVASVFFHSPGYSQFMNKTSNVFVEKENTMEVVESKDSLDHQKIITMDVDSILLTYGQIKGLEIINNHFLIEINALRKTGKAGNLEISAEVKNSAQKQSEYLDSLGILEHTTGSHLLWKRLQNESIDFTTCGENLAQGQNTIKQLIEDWLTSPNHTCVLMNKDFTKMGLGQTRRKRVYIAID